MSGQHDEENLHPHSRRLVAAARERGVDIRVVRFPEGTRTAADAAAAIGCPVGAIVKSIVLTSDDGPLLVLTSGSNRVDYGKVGAVLNVAGVKRADADEAKAATGYPIGGTAPWGHPEPVPVVCDETLFAYDEVWAAAGTPDAVFAITPTRLADVSDARVADIAER